MKSEDLNESYKDRVSAVALACASHAAELELKVNALTKRLAKLGCSCCVKTREVDLEAHEKFCLYRMAMEDLNVIPQKPQGNTAGVGESLSGHPRSENRSQVSPETRAVAPAQVKEHV